MVSESLRRFRRKSSLLCKAGTTACSSHLVGLGGQLRWGRWNNNLVGGPGPPLWKIWKSIGMIIPNIWENKTCSKPPTSNYRTNYSNHPPKIRISLLYLCGGWYILGLGKISSTTTQDMSCPRNGEPLTYHKIDWLIIIFLLQHAGLRYNPFILGSIYLTWMAKTKDPRMLYVYGSPGLLLNINLSKTWYTNAHPAHPMYHMEDVDPSQKSFAIEHGVEEFFIGGWNNAASTDFAYRTGKTALGSLGSAKQIDMPTASHVQPLADNRTTSWGCIGYHHCVQPAESSHGSHSGSVNDQIAPKNGPAVPFVFLGQ